MSFRKKFVLKNFAVPVGFLEDINSPFLIPAADNFMTISLYTVVVTGTQLPATLYSRV